MALFFLDHLIQPRTSRKLDNMAKNYIVEHMEEGAKENNTGKLRNKKALL